MTIHPFGRPIPGHLVHLTDIAEQQAERWSETLALLAQQERDDQQQATAYAEELMYRREGTARIISH